MSQPNVSITELDGALGVTPESAGRLLALAGPASGGPLNVPAAFGRVKDLVTNYVGGPLVEAAAHAIERYGKPVVVVRTAATTAGLPGTPDVSGVHGTSVVTVTGAATDDFEIVFKVLKGGVVGTAGLNAQWSLDGGRNWSPVYTTAGASTAIEIPGTGVTLNFAAGTLLDGDTVTTRTAAPAFTSTDLAAGLDALAASSINWEIVEPVGPVDSACFDTLELKIAALAAAGKYRAWSGGARTPNVGETEAAYLAALSGICSAKASLHGELAAGACKVISSVSGRKYRRPSSVVIAAREAASSEEIDIADVNLGPLTGVSIRDDNGNPDEHDESLNPGLDDARFTVLRTWEGFGGVYVNRPRVFSPAGSDFSLMPHRRVMNLGNAALRAYFIRRLNRPILVNSTTGYILEEEALEIESGARNAMAAVLLAKPKASSVQFLLSRYDNLLSTKTVTGDARIIPLAYPEFVTLTVGFFNPALQVQAV
jgi:hypothetical protein